MNDMQLFTFENQKVRTVTVDGEHFYPLNDGEKDEQQRLLHKL